MKFITKIAGVTLLLFSVISCNLNNSKQDLESNLKFSIVGQQGNLKVVTKAAGQVFITISSEHKWNIKIEDKNKKAISWLSIDKTSGDATTSTSVVLSYTKNNEAERTAFIIISNVIKSDTIVFTQQGLINPSGDENIYGDVTLIEAPQLAGGSNNWYVSYRLKNNEINYSVEWDSVWKLPRWVCFTFDKSNEGKNIKRTNAWNIWDNITPSKMINKSWYPSGYDRGHMVASSDRLESRQANEQTFYYTNMTPQRSGLNQEFWNEMEQWVQDRARSSFNPDIMYVVKGIAFNNGTPTKWVHNHQMAVPDYYYIAVVIKKNKQYHGIGMWVPNIDIPRSAKNISDVVTTIDEIEKRTGVDLFHNLPDDIEQSVESENPHSGFWPGV